MSKHSLREQAHFIGQRAASAVALVLVALAALTVLVEVVGG